MTGHPYRICVVPVLVLPSICFAWGRDGHKISAEIANQHLTPKAQFCVQALLPGQSLVDVATWADDIKNSRRATAPWHYADLPPIATEFNVARDCPKNGCVVSAILKYTAVLRNEKASPSDRSEALKFLVHFVGDAHCPMHAGYAHDKGGNDVAVEFFFNRANLHKVWDSLLIERQKRYWKDYAKGMDAQITSDSMKKWSGCMDPAGWVTESHRIAVQFAYKIPKDGQLGREYFDQAVPIMDQQLSAAGIRLASLLNGIFADWKATPDAASGPTQAEQPAKFVGSRRSNVYHYPRCPVVKTISMQNLIEYSAPPAGKRLHQGCHE